MTIRDHKANGMTSMPSEPLWSWLSSFTELIAEICYNLQKDSPQRLWVAILMSSDFQGMLG